MHVSYVKSYWFESQCLAFYRLIDLLYFFFICFYCVFSYSRYFLICVFFFIFFNILFFQFLYFKICFLRIVFYFNINMI